MSDLLAAVCDRFWRGLLLIDASRRILFANRTARRMLVERDGLQDMQGVLVLRDPKLHARFEARLQEAQASSAGEARSRFVFRLDREGARPAASLLVSRLEPAGVPAIAAFVVAVFDPRSNRRIETALLGELYGLTSAEADVAELLYAGRRFSEVAAELGVSPNTVKTHLSHVFRKCEVSTQAELLQLLALGPRG